MVLLKLKHVYRSKDRQGRDRWLLRLPGRKAITLKGAHGSPEFMANYQAAIDGSTPIVSVRAAKAGTMAGLVPLYFANIRFTALRPATKQSQRSYLERFAEKHGHRSVRGLQTDNVKDMIAAKAGTPSGARNFLIALRGLMEFAIEIGWRDDNPTADLKRPQIKTSGYRTWSEDDIADFQQVHPLGTRQRLALELLLWTGHRRGDIVRLGRQNVADEVLLVVQQKTGAEVHTPIMPPLQSAIDALPQANMTFLVTADGKPFSPQGFSNWFRAACRKAGLTTLSAHGLRKAFSRRHAEAGRSAMEIAALTGHQTLKEVERYTRAADRKRMAIKAMGQTYQEHEFTHGKKQSRTRKLNQLK